MLKFLIFFCAVALFVWVPAHAEDATSSDSSGGVAPASDPSSPAAMPQAPALPRSAVPAAGSASVPRPAPAASAAPAPSDVEPAFEPASADAPVPANNTPLMVAVGAALAALLGLAGYGIAQTRKSKNQGPCGEIKTAVAQNQAQLSGVDGQLSIERALLDELQKKIHDTVDKQKTAVINRAKDTLLDLEKSGELKGVVHSAEKVKSMYDGVSAKVENVKKIIATLEAKRTELAAHGETLAASLKQCLADGAVAGSAKVLGSALPIPEMSPIKALIFDWGGVISNETLWGWLRKNIPELEKRREYFQDLIDRENSGLTTQNEFLAALAAEVKQTADEVALRLNGERALNKELIALVRALHKRYKIGLLSNASSFLRTAIKENSVEDLFDEVLISSEHRMIKPEPEIYRKMLEMLGVAPGEAAFFDDKQKNADAGSAAGIKSFVFTDVEKFRTDLKSIGIKI